MSCWKKYKYNPDVGTKNYQTKPDITFSIGNSKSLYILRNVSILIKSDQVLIYFHSIK